MKRLAFALTALLVLALPSLRAAVSGPTLSRDGVTAISDYLDAATRNGDIPPLVGAVTNRFSEVYSVSTYAARDRGTRPGDIIFNIASMTKPITSVAVMQLVEAGKLHLDDDASQYLPNLAKLQVLDRVDLKAGTWTTRPRRGAITIKELLTHTSGVGYSFSDPRLALVAQKTKLADGDLPLVADPGTRWTYSASTKLLGDIIAKVTGEPLDQYLEAHVLQPLGMRDTAYAVAPAKRSRVAPIYHREQGRWVAAPVPASLPVTIRGDGGLYSTASDYAHFIRMMLNGGTLNGTRLLRADTVREMTRNQIGSLVVPLQPTANPAVSKPFPLGAGTAKWGLGFLIQTASEPGGPSVGSYSWAGIYNTEFWIDPQKEIGGILLMQTLPFYDDKAVEALRGFERRVYAGLQ
ncbi:MAG TPA: serine hydrolase domain-containing protein [Vicinamibacterales bacterium]|nr:serine hydrolase domain-containing protein [Vicinamibacterales bacterium]